MVFCFYLTGLDPARPGWIVGGLNRTCARFVQVLHTDSMKFGLSRRMGHADFYVNNNNNFIWFGSSARQHVKAIYYYFSSLFSEHKFIGIECINTFKRQVQQSRFGGFNDGKIGVFCFNTITCFPYAIPMQNIENSLSRRDSSWKIQKLFWLP